MISGLDARTWAGRRFRECVVDLIEHLGGAPTAPQVAIIQRAAQLQLWAEQQELAFAEGRSFDIHAYSTATNTLRRLCADIGYAPQIKDATPTLNDYLEARASEPHQ